MIAYAALNLRGAKRNQNRPEQNPEQILLQVIEPVLIPSGTSRNDILRQMAIRLIDLSLLSGREAQDVRALLSKNRISVYETPSGNWGTSMAAIWLSDENQLEEAQALLAGYRQNQPRKNIGRVSKRKIATNIQMGPPVRRLLLALFVAGVVVFLAVVVSLIGEHIPLGRNLDARGGMIELYFLWTILLLFCVVWAVRYFVIRRRRNNRVSSQKTNRKVR
jgi:hypothetical protein